MKCTECDRRFYYHGWGLDVCVECFRKTADDFLAALANEPAIENIIVYKGSEKAVFKDKEQQ